MSYLAEADVSVAELADAVAGASEKSLARATKDPAFIEALWLLLKVPQAAKAERFAEALRELFTNLVEHNLQYFLDRETPKHVGPGRMAQSVGDLALLDRDIRRHCEEDHDHHAAFARDWLGHNAYHRGKDIGLSRARMSQE